MPDIEGLFAGTIFLGWDEFATHIVGMTRLGITVPIFSRNRHLFPIHNTSRLVLREYFVTHDIKKRNILDILTLPSVDFSSPNVCLGDSMVFTDISTSLNDPIVTWLWDFGEMVSGAFNFSNLQNPSHAYLSAQKFNVIFTVIDDFGCSNDTLKDVEWQILLLGVSLFIALKDFDFLDTTNE